MSRQASVEINPARVGPYLIERKLGAGGMGTVFLGRHEQTGQQVAVKVLAPSLAREPGLVARFMREIDVLKKLKNPHVVELFDHGVDGDMHYYSMEYVDGETLTTRLRRDKRIPWREVIELSVQICVALKAAHDAGIIHRDLKPSNLLLTPDGQIKLTDFGVAQVFAGSKLTVTGGIIGTAEYMSPEQGQGRRITKRSDLYSLGAVMYVMLTGRPPFSGKTALDVIRKHNQLQFEKPRVLVPDLPYWVDEIVCQLMEKDPEKRFADAYVVNRRLQEVLRKVELSTNELTLDTGRTIAEGSTVEIGSGSSPRSGSAQSAGRGAGHGTLMRDLFRAEIEAQHARSSLRQLLENTWFLAGALVLVIAGLAYWTFGRSVSPQQQFDQGVALLDADEEANWRTVRDDYFGPLVALKSPEWDDKLGPYLKRIRDDERRADANKRLRGRGRRKGNEPVSEIERIRNLADQQRELGDVAAAEKTLSALAALLKDNPQYHSDLEDVEAALGSLRDQLAKQPADRSFVDAALLRADRLAAEGKRDEAAGIWQGVINLYGKDPQAAAEVGQARRMLDQAAGAKSTSVKPQAANPTPAKPNSIDSAPKDTRQESR